MNSKIIIIIIIYLFRTKQCNNQAQTIILCKFKKYTKRDRDLAVRMVRSGNPVYIGESKHN